MMKEIKEFSDKIDAFVVVHDSEHFFRVVARQGRGGTDEAEERGF